MMLMIGYSLMHTLLEPLVKKEHENLHLNVKGYDVGMSCFFSTLNIILQYAVVLTFFMDNPLAMMTIFFLLDDHSLITFSQSTKDSIQREKTSRM